MNTSIVENALGLIIQIGLPIVLTALVAAILIGVLQVATQIEDQAVAFAGKLVAVGVLVYVGASYYSHEIVEFSRRVWGGADFYQ